MSSNTIEDAINVYTDGSSFNHPRVGGAALRIVVINESGNEDSTDIPLLGRKGATNNQMELYACINAIKEAQAHPQFDRMRRIAIHTDSMYVVQNYPRARFSWSKRGWRNANGRPVLNDRLWDELVKTADRAGKKVEFHWVKGHSKDTHNRSVDRLAKQSAKAAVLPPLTRSNVRRKLTDKVLEVGSVGIKGQRISIRIQIDQYLELSRSFKYTYRVLSPGSPYFGCVDIAFSSIPLAAGHHYYVLMNDDPKNPTILKRFRELDR